MGRFFLPAPLRAIASSCTTGLKPVAITVTRTSSWTSQNISLWADAKAPLVSGLSDSGSRTNLHAAAFENFRLSVGMRWNLGDGFSLALLVGTEKRTIRFREGVTDGEISRQSATRGGFGLTYSW